MTIFARTLSGGGGATFTGNLDSGGYNVPSTDVVYIGYSTLFSSGFLSPTSVTPFGTITSLFDEIATSTESYFSGSISGYNLTVSSVTGTYPNPQIGQVLNCSSPGVITPGTYITGGTFPNFTINKSQTVASNPNLSAYFSTGTTLEIGSLSSDPGQTYFNNLVTNTLTFSSALSTYTYSSGTATWKWSSTTSYLIHGITPIFYSVVLN